jgi:hypothetical protein
MMDDMVLAVRSVFTARHLAHGAASVGCRAAVVA